MINRRDFLKLSGLSGITLLAGKMMQLEQYTIMFPARLWRKNGNQSICANVGDVIEIGQSKYIRHREMVEIVSSNYPPGNYIEPKYLESITEQPTSEPVIKRVGLPTLDDFYDVNIDILEIEAGEYHPPRFNINIDRSGRPLLIRPVKDAKVIWVGDQTPEGNGCLYFNWAWTYIPPAGGFIFDGNNGNSQWLFTDFKIGLTGIIHFAGAHHLKFLNLDFAGNIGLNPTNSNSHTFYIASSNDRIDYSNNIEVAHCHIDGGNKTLTGSTIWYDPLPDNIYWHHNTMVDCTDGCIWWGQGADVPERNIQVTDNVFIDCVNSLDMNKIKGVASRNWALRSPLNMRAPFTDDGTNRWS